MHRVCDLSLADHGIERGLDPLQLAIGQSRVLAGHGVVSCDEGLTQWSVLTTGTSAPDDTPPS